MATKEQNQNTFDTVLEAMRKQGCPSANGSGCLYRGPNGTKCAAGHLITDAEWEEADESPAGIADVSWAFLFKRRPELDMSFVRSMQRAHDDSNDDAEVSDGSQEELDAVFMRHFEHRMKVIARENNLIYTNRRTHESEGQ